MSWQDVAVALLVGCAVAFLLWKVRGTSGRRRPDVRVSALVRKKPGG